MHKTLVRDADGLRWSVRARRLRLDERCRPWPGPEQESLHRRLAGVLAPRPLVLPDPLRGRPGGRLTPGDTADVAMQDVRAEFGGDGHTGLDLSALADLARLVHEAVSHLRAPWSDTWQLEAAARGRIRRWARWEVEGREATERAIAAVSAALATGRVPEPLGAVLVDVVDQRPAVSHRRSAGLGRASQAG
ncbi:MAG: hypothetical protein JWQ45_1887 [Blastococcus sp.]|nr:hypothetical protein [Blastococcus sp.]